MSDNQALFQSARHHSMEAVKRLHEKFPAALGIDNVVDYLFSVSERQDARLMSAFKSIVQKTEEVVVNHKDRTWRYKPPYAIRSPDELIAFFQKQPDTKPIEVSKLEKGWVECKPAIDKLEQEHKLIVTRHKKDNSPRVIWPDDPSLSAPLDQEFVDLWNGIALSSPDDVIRFLVQSGRTPAGQVAENTNAGKTNAKVRKSRQSTKQTNKHMAGLFKDYSNLRQKGK